MSFCGGGWWDGGWGGVQSNFYVQPNCSVVVVLCCRWGCDNKEKSKINKDILKNENTKKIKITSK